MSGLATKFLCDACQRSYTWKAQLAGKRAKCKCGHVMTVPQKPPQKTPAEEDDLYALAETPAEKKKAVPAGERVAILGAIGPAAPPSATVPLGYQRGPSARELERRSSKTFLDPKRDIYFPSGLLAIGAILYIGYYAFHYGLGPVGILSTSIGLIVMTLFETAILIGFAMVIASPLGVSFGGVGTAILKFAAIVVFTDGVTTWVDGAIAKYGGGGSGLFGFGIIGFPIALGIYWVMLINLFSMDPGDSWMVVVILSVFYRIVRTVLLIVLLNMILRFGGVASSALPPAAFSSAANTVATSALDDEMDNAKGRGLLLEARKYIRDRSRGAELPAVTEWYLDGAQNVWYQVTRDINGRETPYRVVVELPTDKDERAKCYATLKTWYAAFRINYNPTVQPPDNGENYLLVPLP